MIAIIGANSFLGAALTSKLKHSFKVLQVFNKNTDKLCVEQESCTIDELLSGNFEIEYLFFIASVVNFSEDIDNIKNLFNTNVKLLKQLSNKFNKAKIIHASSVSVYGGNTKEVIDETSRVNPINSYGFSKLWAEQLVASHSAGGINIRISSMFGEQMKLTTFFPKIVESAIKNKKITLFGTGSRLQNYIYVEDVANYFIKAMKLVAPQNLLAVESKSYTNLEIAKKVVEVFPETTIIFLGEDNSDNYIYNNKVSQEQLKITNQNNFLEKINKTIIWMSKQF